jgi:hypothetical protein
VNFHRSAVLTFSVCAALSVAPAAQAAWLYVGQAPFGNDSPDCGPIGKPFCATLQQAVKNAQPGDSILIEPNGGNVGAATITKSINIVGLVAAGVYSPGKPCLTINAHANDVISLTQFTCDQGGAAKNGIQFNSGKSLRLDNVDIRGGSADTCGLLFKPNTNANLLISNSTVSGFGTSGTGSGICIAPRSSHHVAATLDHVTLRSNRSGLRADGAGGAVTLMIANGTIQGNGSSGLLSGANSTLFVKNSTIVGNATGLSHPGGGTLVSLGGNVISGNTHDGSFTSTLNPQ